MSLPPALLQRLAQRGLVQKQKSKEHEPPPAESEEVIAEDYDEMEPDEQHHGPEGYEHLTSRDTRKRTEENFWLERMKARMGEQSSVIGYKGCPNKYNIWHKCTLFCVNRWGEGQSEPSREYMRRYKRMLRKYPLPKGWTEMYDAGCGCYYFCNAADNVVSWLPPTHPKSQVSKSAAAYRRQMEEANGDGGSGGGGIDSDDDGDQHEDDSDENETSQNREIDDIINASMKPRSPPGAILLPQDFPSLQEATAKPGGPPRKQKSRDLERTLSRQRRERERDGGSGRNARRHGRETGGEALDPMDPSAYSDIPRGKWSDGLQKSSGEERKKTSSANGNEENRERGSGGAGGGGGGGGSTRERREEESDDENEEDY